MRDRNLTQRELAEKLGINQSLVSHWLSGKRQPGEIQSLLLAYLAADECERKALVEQSGVSGKQLEILSEVLSAKAPHSLAGDERQLLSWWRSPAKLMDRQIREFVRVWLSQGSVLDVLDPKAQNPQNTYIADRDWHTMLDVILESGDQSFIVGIKANLESWSQAITISRESRRQLGSGHHDPEPSQGSSSDGLVEAQRAQKRAEQDAGKGKRRGKESA